MTPEAILNLASEYLSRAESCFAAGEYESALIWARRAKEQQNRLKIVQTH